jgi:hypothetical protein
VLSFLPSVEPLSVVVAAAVVAIADVAVAVFKLFDHEKQER